MDSELRDLERKASLGDENAADQLKRVRERAALIPSLTDLKKRKQVIDREFAAEGKLAIEYAFKQFFQKFGNEVKVISWYHYTPYWMDGEQCYFMYQSFMDSDSIEYADEVDELSKDCENALNALDNQLSEEESLLEDIFGDHKHIIVTSDGLKIEDYNDHN